MWCSMLGWFRLSRRIPAAAPDRVPAPCRADPYHFHGRRLDAAAPQRGPFLSAPDEPGHQVGQNQFSHSAIVAADNRICQSKSTIFAFYRHESILIRTARDGGDFVWEDRRPVKQPRHRAEIDDATKTVALRRHLQSRS